MGTRPLVALTLIAALAAAVPALADGDGVKHPKDGATYSGHTRGGSKVQLETSGDSVQIVAFAFKCDGTVGHSSLQDIPLKRTKRGWKFGETAYGLVTWEDDQPDENAKTTIWARFARGAKSAKGHYRVQAPRCQTGTLHFFVHR